MNIFDTIFPNFTCLVCGGEINQSKNKNVCDACSATLPRNERVCDKCGCGVGTHDFVCVRCKNIKDTPWHFSRARSVFPYQDPITGLILRLKYNGEGDVAKFVASLLAETFTKYKMEADVIIPVPLAPKRAKERGYNQAGLIAAELSKILNVPIQDNFLVRVKHTEAQKKMTLKERQENLHGAFEIKPPYSAIKGRRVLLVDDVFTTGTTADECARVMKKAKPKSIEVLTIAGVCQKPIAKQSQDGI